MLVESGTNMSIGCPGLTKNTFVVQLEWRCTGQCGDMSKAIATSSGGKTEHGLLKYVKEHGTTVFKNKERLRLDTEMYSLGFAPVTSRDQGLYSCLINNKAKPDAAIKLKVLGKCGSFFLIRLQSDFPLVSTFNESGIMNPRLC